MTTSFPMAEDASWAGGLAHLARLHAAMLAAPAGSCGEIKVKMNELERTLGITYDEALAKGLITGADTAP